MDTAMTQSGPGAHKVGKPNTKKDLLTFDVWYLVLRKIWGSDEARNNETVVERERNLISWFRRIRTVSKDFDFIVRPLVYETAKISSIHVWRKDPWNIFPLYKANIVSYSRKILCEPHPSEKFLKEIREIISKSKLLVHTEWDTTRRETDWVSTCVAISIQEIKKRAVRLEMEVGEGYLRLVEKDEEELVIHRRFSHPQFRRGELHTDGSLLSDGAFDHDVASQPLAIVKIHEASGYQDFQQILVKRVIQQMPPIVKLHLEDYPRLETYRWDLSQLRSLSIYLTDPDLFFGTVSINDLENIQDFELFAVEDYFDDIPETKAFLARLFPKFKQLRSFSIAPNRVQWQQEVSPALIYGLGDSLESLTLHSMLILETLPLLVEDLDRIRLGCPNIGFLSLDWTIDEREQDMTLQTLTTFDNLIYLNLIALHGVRFDTDWTSPDPDYDGAERIFQLLNTRKCGKRITNFTCHVMKSFRPTLESTTYEEGRLVGQRAFCYNVDEKGNVTYDGGRGGKRYDVFADEEPEEESGEDESDSDSD